MNRLYRLLPALVITSVQPGCNPNLDPFVAINTCACQKHWGKTYFVGRDQDEHEYWFMMAEPINRHQNEPHKWRGDINLLMGWDQNFKEFRQSSYFLNRHGTLSIGPNNQAYDVRNSDLGLPNDLTADVALSPAYANFNANLELFIASPGRWWGCFRLPFTHSKWTNRVESSISSPSEQTVYQVPDDYVDATYQGQNHFVVNDVDETVNLKFTGNDAVIQALRGDTGFGQAPRLNAGKLASIRDARDGMGDIRLMIGFDFVRRERGNAGIAIDIVAPAINRPAKCLCPCDLFYFNAAIGSQHAWKFGGLLRGQLQLYHSDKSDRLLQLRADVRAHALVGSHSTRLLGLQAHNTCAFNHWLLLKKFEVKTDGAEYVGLERAANLLKAYVHTKAFGEGQATILLSYRHHGIGAEFGYNFFARQRECLDNVCLCNSDVDKYLYVIKDDAPVVGTSDPTLFTGGFYSHANSNISLTGPVVAGSDVALTGTRILVDTAVVRTAAVSFARDLVTDVAAHPRYISNTIFGRLGYTWNESDYTPEVGVMAKVELGQNNAAWNAWGIWAQAGLVF